MQCFFAAIHWASVLLTYHFMQLSYLALIASLVNRKCKSTPLIKSPFALLSRSSSPLFEIHQINIQPKKKQTGLDYLKKLMPNCKISSYIPESMAKLSHDAIPLTSMELCWQTPQLYLA